MQVQGDNFADRADYLKNFGNPDNVIWDSAPKRPRTRA